LVLVLANIEYLVLVLGILF